MAVVAGTRFDRYEIISPLGSGGMGEVYLARDTRLERKIALKLLPQERTKDDQRLLRFEQEAKAASALNHPNIITIYEIGDFDSIHFIATEFIDGRTLRQILTEGKLSAINAIDTALQIASALSAAHESGIIHRDIKPENVMLRRDGIVKVLDFGLAKLTEARVGEWESGRVGESESGRAGEWESRRVREGESGGAGEKASELSPTLPLSHSPTPSLSTDPGTVMGTATYMSPEQARGLRVDARRDMLRLGVMLYEMVAGRAPFGGDTPIDVMTQVLEREPRPLTSVAHGAPPELQRIVGKALRKDREERYQTVKDLFLDLKSLKRELEATTTLTYSVHQGTESGSKSATGYETTVVPGGASTSGSSSERSDPVIIRATSSAEYIVNEIKRHKRGVLITFVALLLTVAAGAAFFIDRDHAIDSIAVLPFFNQNDDPGAGPNAGLETELLSDA